MKVILEYLQTVELRTALYSGLDVGYMVPFFHQSCMRQIRFGLEDNLDVSLYRRYAWTWGDMERHRLQQLYGK